MGGSSSCCEFLIAFIAILFDGVAKRSMLIRRHAARGENTFASVSRNRRRLPGPSEKNLALGQQMQALMTGQTGPGMQQQHGYGAQN